jgi:hypothetical protein
MRLQQPRRRISLPIAKRMTRGRGDAVCTSLPQHQASGSGGDRRQRVDVCLDRQWVTLFMLGFQYTTNGRIREDQRMVHDLYLVQIKSPSESKGSWDFVKLVATIPPDQAFRPLDRSKCSLVGK